MMAKMFYTLDEAKAALGKSEEEIKQYAREGRLREFRDGPRLMFKADQVEQLKAESAGGGEEGVDLGISDSGGMIGLVDTAGPSGTSITLSEADSGQSSGAGMSLKDDTALASDLGLSGTAAGAAVGVTGASPGLTGTGAGASGAGIGLAATGTGMSGTGAGMSGTAAPGLTGSMAGLSESLGGMPSPGRPSASGTGLSGSAAGRSGVNVFGVEEGERVDPSAQTAIPGGVREQVNLEGVGSGSGLLDLTREADDTSLGAVLDSIGPGGTGARPAIEIGSGTGLAGMDEPVVNRAAMAPVLIQKPDPMAPAFGAAALGGFIVMLFGAFALISAVTGSHPDTVNWFNDKAMYIPIAFGLGLAVLLFVIGALVGKAVRR